MPYIAKKSKISKIIEDKLYNMEYQESSQEFGKNWPLINLAGDWMIPLSVTSYKRHNRPIMMNSEQLLLTAAFSLVCLPVSRLRYNCT